MLYMETFTINIPQMLAYVPYMDPMGYWSFHSPSVPAAPHLAEHGGQNGHAQALRHGFAQDAEAAVPQRQGMNEKLQWNMGWNV